MGFESIEGQERAGRQLAGLLKSGRLPHALLFLGSAGTGRLEMARRLAAALLCPDSTGADCRLLAGNAHPDYTQVGLPEGRQSLPLQVVRDLQHTAGLRPVRADRRVFVVNDAERMTDEAANAFLKLLEEPPGRCVFILIASSLRRVPETIISRCRLVRFANLPQAALSRRLTEEGYADDDAHWLAGRCWGAPGLALRSAREGLHERNRELLDRLASAAPEDNLELADWLADLAKEAGAGSARDSLQDLLECLAVYYRDLAVLAAAPEDDCPLVNRDREGAMRQRAAAAGDADDYLDLADTVVETIEMIGANAQMRLALDRMFTRLCGAEPQT
ncbi:MAG: DNA polymerase III subunit delta' [Candidatus Brocadiaceae bacterium]|nr:DNA polymerase III subunit delta' [Candidatus Brocadiaceae bacterium]